MKLFDIEVHWSGDDFGFVRGMAYQTGEVVPTVIYIPFSGSTTDEEAIGFALW